MKVIIVDVGAGLRRHYKSWLAKHSGLHIHAIEPHPELAAELRALDFQRLHVHEFAATAKNESVVFHLCSDRGSSSTLPFVTANIRRWLYPMGRRPFRTLRTINVEGKTLSAFFAEHNIGGIALLNIDVQGNSSEVLRGLTDTKDWNRVKEINVKVHTINFELYAGQSVNYQILDMCRRHYYTLRHRRTFNRGQEDVLGLRSDIAVMRGYKFTSAFDWSKRAVE